MLKPAALAFSGKIASGKSEISTALSSSLGWPYASFGNYLRSVARAKGQKDSREVLQDLGESFMAADVRGFCEAVLSQANWVQGQGIIIDGVRHSKAFSTIQLLVAPLPVLLVFIEVPDDVRTSRLLKSGNSNRSLRELDSHSTEQQVSSTLSRLADLKIDGTQEPGQLVEIVLEHLRHRLGES